MTRTPSRGRLLHGRRPFSCAPSRSEMKPCPPLARRAAVRRTRRLSVSAISSPALPRRRSPWKTSRNSWTIRATGARTIRRSARRWSGASRCSSPATSASTPPAVARSPTVRRSCHAAAGSATRSIPVPPAPPCSSAPPCRPSSARRPIREPTAPSRWQWPRPVP